ncbi:hypothetical protein FFLO_04165 [Filobasidium floriforme]|uniref:Uncharacterized protein n=1 Tax=Filobasidium floriforme TaxID=5210 RepID=A0A8K0NPJ4_9TREE|nr:hypothetical protein FFLO_04165 [Filobasidium floriforme]
MTSEHDKNLFDEVLKTSFYDGGDIRWDDIFSAPDQGPFTITTHPDGSWTDGSLQEPLKTEAAHQQAVTSDLHPGYYRRSVDAESHISEIHTQSGSAATPSGRFTGNTFNSLVAPEGGILASSARWELWKDIPPPGSVAPIAYCTLERFSRWLRECEPYLPQATAESLAGREVRERYKRNRRLYAFIQWAAEVSNSTDDVPDKFCFLCFEAVGIFYPQSQRTKGVTCACDFIKMEKRSELGIAKSRNHPRDDCTRQQQSGLAPSQRAPSQIAASDEIPEKSWPSCGTRSPASSIRTESGLSLSKRSLRAPCSPLAPTGGTIPAKSSKSRKPGSRKGDPRAKGKVVEIPHCTLESYSRYLAHIRPFEIAPTPEELQYYAKRKEHTLKEPRGFIAWAATETGHTNDFKGTICWECFEYTGKFHPKRTRNDDAACRCESVTKTTLWKFSDTAKVGTLRFPIYEFEGTVEKHQVLANRTIVTVA